ncbi:hypothetical protein VI08_20070 [Luteibacter yeojuensis]|uniref:Uncharacterized protein n=1 Tax=Luteibacter yeojuensis TaxID=345309 RepID=A0A0F3K1Q9_9GAMM|nr:hypothetical protein VI08_20070 [Luteibacter yeojuensis]
MRSGRERWLTSAADGTGGTASRDDKEEVLAGSNAHCSTPGTARLLGELLKMALKSPAPRRCHPTHSRRFTWFRHAMRTLRRANERMVKAPGHSPFGLLPMPCAAA